MNPCMNRLLSDLPDSELKQITPHLRLVSLVKGQNLWLAGQTPEHVYYPVGALVAMMNDLPDGYSVASHSFGNTCMVGLGVLHGPSFYRACVCCTGLAYRLPAAAWRQIRICCPHYMARAQDAILRSVRWMSLNMACVKHHTVSEQLVRWILTCLDQSVTDVVAMTHLELTEILGVRREAVTLAMVRLSAQGLLSYSRGEIHVINRLGLESQSCDCYWTVQDKVRPRVYTFHGSGS